jgi:hypothetical protein
MTTSTPKEIRKKSKGSMLTRFLGRIFWYFGRIIWVPEETAKDLVEQGSAALCTWPNIWGGLLLPGPDYPPSPGIFTMDQSVQLSVHGWIIGADICPRGRTIWGPGYSPLLNPDNPPPGLQRL